jgi:hypothetical protein
VLDSRSLIQVNLPKASDITVVDDTEVVLAVRIVVFVELIEGADL